MRLFFSVVGKDLRLLARDRAALLLLFCMPALLALIITLVQQNVYETTQSSTIQGLLVDQDHGDLGDVVVSQFDNRSGMGLTRWDGSYSDALEAVNGGRYQFCILIAAGTLAALESNVRRAVLEPENGIDDAISVPELRVTVDAILGGGFKLALQNQLQQIMLGLENHLKLTLAIHSLRNALAPLDSQINARLEALPDLLMSESKSEPERVPITLVPAQRAGFAVLPTATQQTLPAMIVFGLFFIVVPLAGAVIRERQSGLFIRLAIAPVSTATLLGARLTAWTLVGLGQFVLIGLVGQTLLPWLGGAPLVLGSTIGLVLLIVLAVTLAACGTGLLLGVLCRTTDQAGAVGPIAVVIAGALGGIMVPVFVMPPVMQTLSRLSPLEWGHRAMLDVLVRGAELSTIAPRLALLLALFGITLMLSWVQYKRR